MKKIYVITVVCIFLVISSLSSAQRVAPGVPPQHYEQPPVHQQHYQQPPPPNYQQHAPPNVNSQQYQHGQQVPVQNVDQYGNVIQQQQQQQPPVQQQPHGQHQQAQPGGQRHGHGAPQVLNTGNLEHEKEHIAEHMDVPIDTSKMSDQELQFHYFKMHDADNNNKLDGCELIKSLIHWHEKDGKKEPTEVYSDEQITSTVDFVINQMDKDKDGYISYTEFITNNQQNPDPKAPEETP